MGRALMHPTTTGAALMGPQGPNGPGPNGPSPNWPLLGLSGPGPNGPCSNAPGPVGAGPNEQGPMDQALVRRVPPCDVMGRALIGQAQICLRGS